MGRCQGSWTSWNGCYESRAMPLRGRSAHPRFMMSARCAWPGPLVGASLVTLKAPEGSPCPLAELKGRYPGCRGFAQAAQAPVVGPVPGWVLPAGSPGMEGSRRAGEFELN